MQEGLPGSIMFATPFYVTLAKQTLEDLREVYELEPQFAPVLFIHTLPIELARQGRSFLQLAPLSEYDQEEWPTVIRSLVGKTGASLWGLATEVTMRYRSASGEPSRARTEDWLVYLLSHEGGMMVWGAPILPGRKLGEMRELTDDPRLQRMLAHLSEVNLGHSN
jgi:hypothetical protein